MTVKTEKFQEICSKILKAVDSNPLSEITETLELIGEDDTLYMNITNRDYYVSSRIELDDSVGEFRAAVNASQFLKLICQVTTETVELTAEETYLKVKANGVYKIPMIFNDDKLLSLPIITIDNVTYSFIFNNDEYLCAGTFIKTDAMGGGIKPQNNIRNRIVNCIGTWNECNYNSSNGIITIGSNYYVFYNGAYIRVNSNSSSTTYYYSTKSSIKIYSGGIFPSSSPEYYPNWKFNQHGFTTLESESLNFNSTTKQWTHG